MEIGLAWAEGLLAVPADRPPSSAVLVLSGSSGRIERDRARLLARHGAAALTFRWFGGAGQPPGICEVPLDTFLPALDQLADLSDRLVVLGVSKSAEAALLLAARDPRLSAVVALSPTSVVWANVGPGADGHDRPQRSSWTWRGVPLPFVPYDDDWAPHDDPPSYRGSYEQSLRTAAGAVVDAARIPVEAITADVLLAAGGDDRLWPSLVFAREILDRRRISGLPTRLVTSPAAGHRVILPGEPVATGGQRMARGGSEPADRALGEQLWPHLLALLDPTIASSPLP
jgi:dienelactone hydrolase